MERRANFAAVGAFVVLAIVLAGAFVYWYSGGRDRASYVRYEIYFPGSVTGLSPGSAVRYLGVEVGKVRRIRLDPRNSELVQVTADIDRSAPITEATAANLSMLSFATGLLYIDLRQTKDARDVLPPVPSEEFPVINSVRSGFDDFLNSLPDLAGNIAELLESAQQIFSTENAQKMSETVQNLHLASQAMPDTLRRIDILLADMTETSLEARRLAVGLDDTAGKMGEHVGQLAERLHATAEHLEKASAGIQVFVDENRAGFTSFTHEGLPQLQRTLAAAESATDAVRDLARSLKENPSQLLYRGEPGGVEVPR
ncbi:MAG TPA: MlaD family protein [Steroidobacteraceae bacterium]|nr:MlaD family protein [Steroidobacteraceae bacterium]